MKKTSIFALVLLFSLSLLACGREKDQDSFTFEVYDRQHEEILAYIDKAHWHGQLRTLKQNASLDVSVNIISKDNETIDLFSEETTHHIQAIIHGDGREDVVAIENLGHHIVFTGLAEGATEIVFQWLDNDRVVYSTPPILLTVSDEVAEEPLPISIFELYPVGSTTQRLAYIHGDHWHGSLPIITVNTTINIEAFIRDAEDKQVVFDASNSFTVTFAPGAATDVVSLENHNGYVSITGLKSGLTLLVFNWLVDGEVVYSTPAITVRVND